MSTQNTQEPTPPHVAELATQTAPINRLTLIGVFGTEAAPAALLRARDGTIQRVEPGDSVAGKTVTAIGADRVILSKGAQNTILKLPET